ncbi:MAG: response regulator, partial [Bacillota bacterium]
EVFMFPDDNNSLKNLIETRKMIYEKYEKMDFFQDKDRSLFLSFMHAVLGKQKAYDHLHLLIFNQADIIQTSIEFGSAKVNEITVKNKQFFDKELAKFTEENMIFIDHLNTSILTQNQVSHFFDIENTNQAIDVPLFHQYTQIGIIRFEVSTRPFSELFIQQILNIFDFLKQRELHKIVSHINEAYSFSKTYIKHIIHKHRIAIFTYHISSRNIAFEDGSELVFKLNEKNELNKDFLFHHIHPEDLELIQLTMQQVIREQDGLSATFRINIDQTYKTFLTHMNHTIINHEPYIIGFIEDMTNPLEKVEHLEQFQINIDSFAKEKIKDLEKALHLANENTIAKSSFISNMSHEIRTPMNSIMGYAQLLSTRDLPSEERDYVNKINEASKHLLSIVNDILDISKIEAGKIVIEHTGFRLDKLLSSVKDIFDETIKQKRLYFDIETLHCPNFLVGDENRIRQVLINLVSNAIKFTETGGISLVVSAKDTYHAEEFQFEFKVKDTGIGMTPVQLKKLFNDFEQADISTSRIYGGTGLGLSISKRLAILMKGNLSVISSLNDGTEFTLMIPLSTEKDNLEASIDELHKTVPRKGSHILLADDNILNQKLAKSILENMGMKVTLADQGHIALDLAKRTTFDLIILDIQMPVMDGIEAAKNIRLFNQKTPIIAMTGNASLEDKELALSAGMNDYLVKPIDPTSLHRALVRFIPDVK